ncbi:2-oxoacid:acceptor oxidoreductase subunit alpha [Candidatus Kuenenbacteria bacterium]|nr:2-oxoacid:acceptor oxidoreductase subunit alpha [Candidatus Kuenenbacteria bacterium]
MKKQIAIKIGGEAGQGIKVSGLILGRAFFGAGAYIFGYSEYPSLIRGGHNTYQLNISEQPICSATKKVDVLLALDKKTAELHQSEIKEGGFVIFDGLNLDSKSWVGINLIDLPLAKLAEENGGVIMRNTVALGALAGVVDFDIKAIESEIEKNFKNKGEGVVGANKKAARAGYDYLANNYKNKKVINGWSFEKRKNEGNLLTGNEAIAMGMLQAGCDFYTAYPMTPATSILHILIDKQKTEKIVVHQAEDEISAIGVAIGASLAGARAATGTSGGGFSLMTESLGLSAITETPIVVINSQRPAPATGLPTWTEQGDLNFVLNASHGEFPRVVLAPGDAEESFYAIQEAFNLAEKWQLPVIVLLDKLLSESDFTLDSLDKDKIKIKREGLLSEDDLQRIEKYKRYEITPNGVSNRALPGQAGGVHLSNSDEHDEYGFSSEEAEDRKRMMDKRFAKVKVLGGEMQEPVLYGKEEADLTVVGWGAVKGVVLDALKNVDESKKINFLHLKTLWPFPERRVRAVLEKSKNILLIENNKTGQLGDLIKKETGVQIKNRFLKYDGRPFFREEVVDKINELTH